VNSEVGHYADGEGKVEVVGNAGQYLYCACYIDRVPASL
jgi:hypothetical protein